jgi:hypothetical protein
LVPVSLKDSYSVEPRTVCKTALLVAKTDRTALSICAIDGSCRFARIIVQVTGIAKQTSYKLSLYNLTTIWLQSFIEGLVHSFNMRAMLLVPKGPLTLDTKRMPTHDERLGSKICHLGLTRSVPNMASACSHLIFNVVSVGVTFLETSIKLSPLVDMSRECVSTPGDKWIVHFCYCNSRLMLITVAAQLSGQL